MEGPPAPPEKKEQKPGSYEHALELFQQLREEGVKNPLNPDNPKVQEALDALDEYERQTGIGDMTSGIATIERAREMVRAARIFLDAGFDGKQVTKDAKERMDDLYAYAQRESNPEITAYVSEELEKLEPKSQVERAVEAKLKEAAAASKPSDAVGVLTCVLFDPRFKRAGDELRARLTRARDEYKLRI